MTRLAIDVDICRDSVVRAHSMIARYDTGSTNYPNRSVRLFCKDMEDGEQARFNLTTRGVECTHYIIGSEYATDMTITFLDSVGAEKTLDVNASLLVLPGHLKDLYISSTRAQRIYVLVDYAFSNSVRTLLLDGTWTLSGIFTLSGEAAV